MSRLRPAAADQHAHLDRLAAAGPLSADEAEALLALLASPADEGLRRRAIGLLVQHFAPLTGASPAWGRRAHAAVVGDPRHPIRPLALAYLSDDNLPLIPWRSTEEVVAAVECLYATGEDSLSSDDCHRRARDLVKHAGRHFLDQGRSEEAFQLLYRVPVPAGLLDADFFRLRNTLVLYEQRRVHRARRSLLVVLAAVMAFLAVASPLLFLHLEGDRRAADGLEPLTFFEALYWTGETATTLGYGDVVPKTRAGRALAIFDSLLGMTVIALIAGLILGVVTPRQLP